MKSIVKKGLVVLLTSLFATCVFANTATTSTVTPAAGETTHAVVKHKMHCKKNKHGKCKKHHKAKAKKAAE